MYPAGQTPEARLSRSKSPQQRSVWAGKPVISDRKAVDSPLDLGPGSAMRSKFVLGVRTSLAPPACPRLHILRMNLRANKPSNSGDFSFELRTLDGRAGLLFSKIGESLRPCPRIFPISETFSETGSITTAGRPTRSEFWHSDKNQQDKAHRYLNLRFSVCAGVVQQFGKWVNARPNVLHKLSVTR